MRIHRSRYADGALPYLLDFLGHSKVYPRVNVSSATDGTINRVETPLLVSDAGAVLTLLNWQTRAVPPATTPPLSLKVSVQVELKSKVTTVESVAQGKPIEFTCIPVAGSAHAGKSSFVVSFAIELAELGDFVMMRVS